jgi:hypothetical protein
MHNKHAAYVGSLNFIWITHIYLIISESRGYTSMDSSNGDWAIVSNDGAITRVKIMHKTRGRYNY